MSRLLCLSLSSLSLCAGPAQAQLGQPPIVPTNIGNYVVPWPDSVASGSFLCIEPGDYDGDQVPDAAVLRGTRPVILLDPAVFGASLVLPCDANDIACLAGGGNGGADVLATVGAGGLTLWDFDPLLEGQPQTLTPYTVGALPWVGAMLVVGGNLDGDTDADLLGVGANGRTIQFLVNQSLGGFTSLPSFLAVEPVRQLGLVEWDGDAAPEVWALTTKALDVYELSGLRVANYRNFSAVAQLDAVAVLPHPQPGSPSADRIVWVTKVSSTSPNQMLLVLYQGGYEPSPINLGDVGVVGAATGDFDHDGDSDLIMSAKDLHLVRRVLNQKAQNVSGRTFEGYPAGTADFWAGGNGSGAPPNLATLPWIDWDNDAELDLAVACEPMSCVLLYPGVDPQAPELDPGESELIASGHPAFRSVEYITAWLDPDHECPESSQQEGRLILTLENPWNAPVNGVNVLDLVVYQQGQLDADQPYPDNVAIRHHRYPLNTAQDPSDPAKFKIAVMIPEDEAMFDGRYFCQVRAILNPGPNQQILRSYVGGFTSDFYEGTQGIPIGSWQEIMDLPFGWPGSIPHDLIYCEPGAPGAVNGGGFRPLSRMPPFGPGYSGVPGDVTNPPGN